MPSKRKGEDETKRTEEEEEEGKPASKKEPLSLDELIARQKAEEAARSKVRLH